MDIALDPLTGDLLLTNGDLTLVAGKEAIAQQILIRFNFFKGEWFLNSEEGTPWYQEILGVKADPARVDEIFRKLLLTTPGVLSIVSLSFSLDHQLRTGTLVFNVLTTEGPLSSSDYAPFILEL